MANSTLGSANSAFLSSFQGLRLSSNVRCAGVQAPQRRRVGLLVEVGPIGLIESCLTGLNDFLE